MVRRGIQWLQTLLFPALALVVIIAGWAALRPSEARVAYADWLPADGAVGWARLDSAAGLDRRYSVQQGPLTNRELLTVAPSGTALESDDVPLWRVEFNHVPTRDVPAGEGPAHSNNSLTFAVSDGLTLLAIESPAFRHSFIPGVPVLTDGLIDGEPVQVQTEVLGAAPGARAVRARVEDSAMGPECSDTLITVPWADAHRLITLMWCRGRGLVGYGEGDGAEAARLVSAPPPEAYLPQLERAGTWPQGPVRGESVGATVHRLGTQDVVAQGRLRQVAVLPDGMVLHGSDAGLVGLRERSAPDAGDMAGVALEQSWRIVLDGESTALAAGSVGGVVADSGGHLLAFTPRGGVLWRERLPDVVTALVVDGDVVMAYSLDGRMTAFDIATGVQRWSAATGRLADGPQVLVAGGGLVAFITGDSVAVRDVGTGQQRFERPGLMPWAVALTEGSVLVLENSLGLVSFDVEGREQWRRNPGAVLNGQLVVAGETVVASTEQGAVAFDLRGERRWHSQGTWHRVLPAADDHVVLAGQDESRLMAPDGGVRATWPGIDGLDVLAVTPFGVLGDEVWR